MICKKLIPSFGCREGQAIILDEGQEYFSNDILSLCRYYSDNGADELLIHDLSETDEDHERTILLIKEVAREIDIPIITGGHVKRLEDIKKYLYAGAKAVFLDVADDNHVDLIKEGSHRFGSEKIYGYLSELSYLKRAEEYEQLGASALVIDCHCQSAEDQALLSACGMPVILFCDEDTPQALASFLKFPRVEGVLLTVPEEYEGNCMNLKQELKKRGIEKQKVVYSKETPLVPLESEEPAGGRRQLPGSMAHVPSAAGLILAGEVLLDLAEPYLSQR